MRRIVLGYSGSVEGSIAIPWLADRYQAEVVAVTLDLGQRGELVAIREQALSLGALRSHVIDVRDDYARRILLPALQAGALAGGRVPTATALARPLIVDKLVDVARMEGASAIAHSSRTHGDHAQIESAIHTLRPELTVIAPAQTWQMTASEERDYAHARGIPAPQEHQTFHATANLWGRSIALLTGDDLSIEPPASVFTLTRAAHESPDHPAYLEIEFDAGMPVKVNGIEMPILEMIESLEIIGGTHGVGRTERVFGGRGRISRWLQEAPAGTILQIAHAALTRAVVDPQLAQLADTLALEYSTAFDTGRWFGQTRASLDAFTRSIQPGVTGWVKLKLFKGDCRVVGRRSAFARQDSVEPTGVAEPAPDRTTAPISEER